MRPVDANIIYEVEGDGLFLYDTKEAAPAPKINDEQRYLYNYRALKAKEMLSVMKFRLKERIRK
jgi:hypothetical protein